MSQKRFQSSHLQMIIEFDKMIEFSKLNKFKPHSKIFLSRLCNKMIYRFSNHNGGSNAPQVSLEIELYYY